MDITHLAKWTLLPQLFGQVHFPCRGVWLVFIIIMRFVGISELYANRVDHDQRLHSEASTWVYTVCQCPFYGMLSLNGLRIYVKNCI